MSNAATNKQIYDVVLPIAEHVAEIKQSVSEIVRRLDRQNGSISRHEIDIGEAKASILLLQASASEDADKNKTINNRWWNLSMLVIGVAFAVLQALMIGSISDLRTADAQEHAAIETYKLATPISTPTHTLHPSRTPIPITETPKVRTAATYRASSDEITYLAALCYVEVRGMGSKMATACASVIDTVYKRISVRKFSDGTVYGTLTYDCFPDTVECHFPAYVVNGCDEYINCPYDSPFQLDLYKSLVDAYLSGDLLPDCIGYIYYGFKPFDDDECTIKSSDSGQFINFHN